MLRSGPIQVRIFPRHRVSRQDAVRWGFASDKKSVTPDSITVIHLGPDHPPIVKTVYETVPNTIAGAPYMAISGDGRYGFVTSRSGKHEPEAPDLVSVIDLADADFKVVQTVKLPNPKMALMHSDGRRLLIPYNTGIRVFEMRAGRLEPVQDNPTDFRLGSVAITSKGDRVAVAAAQKGVDCPSRNRNVPLREAVARLSWRNNHDPTTSPLQPLSNRAPCSGTPPRQSPRF